MADLPMYPPDTAICRLLAAGPLPTAGVAARLAMPERTARHRLRQLRRSGVVVAGQDGLHHLAEPGLADLAGRAEPDGAAPTPSEATTSEATGGWGPTLAAAAAAVVSLAVAILIARTRTTPPAPSSSTDSPIDPWWGVGR